jgi:KDO2-lipid IV(A) lauroyltransferase
MARLVLALLWMTRFLPLPLLAQIGEAFGDCLYWIGHERRKVARINVCLCFPEFDAQARETLVRRHFRALGRSILDRSVLWWGSREQVMNLVRVEGDEHRLAVAGRPLILFAAHFVGLEMGGVRINLDLPVATMYSRQKNAVFDAALRRGRGRFPNALLYSRQDGMRPVIRAIRDGYTFYYLPDMDFGARDAVFVPFFEVPAATITGLARLAAISGAAVVPCITSQLPGGEGYVVRYYPAWNDFPGPDQAADARRMNAFIEERVREMPEQYFWVHKRFKTRPNAEPSPYDV